LPSRWTFRCAGLLTAWLALCQAGSAQYRQFGGKPAVAPRPVVITTSSGITSIPSISGGWLGGSAGYLPSTATPYGGLYGIGSPSYATGPAYYTPSVISPYGQAVYPSPYGANPLLQA